MKVDTIMNFVCFAGAMYIGIFKNKSFSYFEIETILLLMAIYFRVSLGFNITEHQINNK
jgi:hypothetical protein